MKTIETIVPAQSKSANILDICRLGAIISKRSFILFSTQEVHTERYNAYWSGEGMATKIATAFLSFPQYDWLWTKELFIVFDKRLGKEVLQQLAAMPQFQYHEGMETALVHSSVCRLLLWMAALHQVNMIINPTLPTQKLKLKMKPDEKLSIFLSDLRNLCPNLKQNIQTDEIYFINNDTDSHEEDYFDDIDIEEFANIDYQEPFLT